MQNYIPVSIQRSPFVNKIARIWNYKKQNVRKMNFNW